MSLRVAARDARRGGLVILGAAAGDGERLARTYADGGYDTVVGGAADDPVDLIAGLAEPVFVLALPNAAASVWAIAGIAAASIVADGRVAPLISLKPGAPAIVHLAPGAHAELAEAFEAAQPSLPVHRLDASADGERLLLLRTLRLFSANTGGRGEV